MNYFMGDELLNLDLAYETAVKIAEGAGYETYQIGRITHKHVNIAKSEVIIYVMIVSKTKGKAAPEVKYSARRTEVRVPFKKSSEALSVFGCIHRG